jgi:HEAT repeat protein
MASPRGTDVLLAALRDPARDVRIAAARSLGRLGAADAIPALVIAGVDGRIPNNVTMLALLDIGPPAVPVLLTLTADGQPAVRAAAVEVVGLLGTAADAAPLLEHLADPAAAVRAMSAGALGRLGAGVAQDALVRALDDRVPAVRTAAATALGHIGGPHATGALVAMARTDSFEPARAAADAVARIDPGLVNEMAREPDAGPHLVEAADRAGL